MKPSIIYQLARKYPNSVFPALLTIKNNYKPALKHWIGYENGNVIRGCMQLLAHTILIILNPAYHKR